MLEVLDCLEFICSVLEYLLLIIVPASVSLTDTLSDFDLIDSN